MPALAAPLVRRRLLCHPRTPCVAVHEVTAEVGIDGPDIVVDYRIMGDIQKLRVPNAGMRIDPDRLWEHTCCEMFVAPARGEAYVEWNFSPTGQLARFDFVSYRRRSPSSAPAAARVSIAAQPAELRLEARAPLGSSGDSVRISLTAVIEDAAGGLSYWAMRHPCDRPDFHHRDGFSVTLTLTPSPAVLGDRAESP